MILSDEKAIIQTQGLTYGREGVEILKNINLSITPGEFISILGRNGSGKTTLLKLIQNLLIPTKGFISISGQCATVFQNASLFPWMTVQENLLLIMKSENKLDCLGKYLRFAGMSHYAHHYPGQLSGGMQQKINIIRSFCSGADILLMDEPYLAIDTIQKEELTKLLVNIWKEEKKTVIFVTHDIEEAIGLSTRILLLSHSQKTISKTFEAPNETPSLREIIHEELEQQYE